MQSIFDEIIDRRNTGSLKWEVPEGELPMWVADMDFRTAPEITEAIIKRAEHGVFGYTLLSDEWYQAYQNWWNGRHGLEIEKDRLLFCAGVVPAISSIVRKMTTVGENILVMTPVYNAFFGSILDNGRKVVESRLRYQDGEYQIDFADLEEKLADPKTTMLILCNPHNPIGKIWEKETLERIGGLCRKHHVLVLADEIHCDLTQPGKSYIPFASLSADCRDNSITCIAPTKTFNLAGIQTSAVFVPNETLYHKVKSALHTDKVAEPNAFAVIAAVAAFEQGGGWLDELREYLWQNRLYAQQFIEKEIPKLHAVKGEATYLLWLDGHEVIDDSSELCRTIRQRSGLYLTDGSIYGSRDGFLRMNLACPRKVLADGLQRLKKVCG